MRARIHISYLISMAKIDCFTVLLIVHPGSGILRTSCLGCSEKYLRRMIYYYS